MTKKPKKPNISGINGKYHYDESAAQRVVDFFSNHLVHTKGKWQGQKFKLLPWQEQQVIRPLFGWKRVDGTRKYRKAYIEIPKKNGKALALDTPILTLEGWKTIGQLTVGAIVFDENGNKCVVLGISEIMKNRDCFRVIFSDGTTIIADKEHQWKLPYAKRLKLCEEGFVFEYIYTTEEMKQLLDDRMATRPIGQDKIYIAGARAISSLEVPFLEFPLTYIVSIEPIASVPVQCIQVNSPSGLFLAGKGMIPTHNSELGAGIALYLLFADGEPGSEVYSAANDRDQARIVFDVAKYMVQADVALRTRGKPFKYTITVEQTNSFYRVLSAIVKSKHGFNIHGAIFDELHAQKDRDLWDVLTAGSGAARRQPLIMALTTAGQDRNSICWEIHDYACKVRDGVIEDDAFLPVIFQADESCDWTDPTEWAKVNPSLGITITEEYLQEELKFAKESLSRQAVFRQFHLNHWLQHSSKWIDLDIWNENGRWEIKEGLLIGRECYAGLDLSSNRDITALILVFPPDDKDKEPFILLSYFWIPEDNIHRRVQRDRVPYDMWIEKGYIKATPGNVVDLRYIRETIKELGESYKIKEVAYDRWRATQLVQELGDCGFIMVPFGQGYRSMAPACEEFERVLLGRRIGHGNNPVLKWMASNIVVLRDPAGNIKPNKDKSTDRIDGIVATVMALDRAVRHQQEMTSVYETRGVLEIEW